MEHPFDKLDSPRSRHSGMSVSSNSTLTSKRRSTASSSRRRSSRPSLSASSSATTLFISTAGGGGGEGSGSPRTPPQDINDVFGGASSRPTSMRRASSQLSTLEQELARSEPGPVSINPRSPLRPPTQPKTKREVESMTTTATEATEQQSAARIFSATERFLRDISITLQRILLEVAWPLVAWLLSLPFTIFSPSQPPIIAHDEPPRSQTGSHMTRHFAEKFKYIICTSFLLTPTLSISLYDSNPEEDSTGHCAVQATDDDRAERKLLAQAMPDSRGGQCQIVVCHPGLPGAIESAHQGTNSSPLPPLVGVTLSIRNAAAFAIACLLLTSPSWHAWFRTSLLITALSWSAIVAHHAKTGGPSTLTFTVHLPSTSCTDDIDTAAIIRRRTLHGNLIRGLSSLLGSAKQTDKAFNKALSAIQEVELVARGFKISHPLPPISRIEAATSALASTPNKVKPFDGLDGSVNGGGGATISRSASAVSNDSYMKHSETPTNDGPRSPAVEVRRMAYLRRRLMRSLEESKNFYRVVIDKTASIVDNEELNALREMYALDALDSNTPTANQPLPPFASGADSRGPSPLPTSASMLTFHQADDSFRSTSSMQKRSSWSMTVPRSSGPNAAPFRSTRNAMPNMADTNPDDTFTALTSLPSSPASPKPHQNGSVKRFSLSSEGSIASTSANTNSLSRNGSLLKNNLSDGGGSEASTPRSAVMPTEGSAVSKPKGSRLSYIAEGSSANGPNTSPAAKRQSYQSSDSRPGSQLSQNRRDSLEAVSKTQGSPVPSWNGSLRRRGATGILPSMGAAEPLAGAEPELADPQTLLGLKHAFEQLHTIRRRALCHLLALNFATDPTMADGRSYWSSVSVAIEDCGASLDRTRSRMEDVLSGEMSGDYWERRGAPDEDAGPETVTPAEGRSASRLESLGNIAGSTGLVPFSGFEDKTQALALSIRSIQVKLRACTEELQMGMPNSLHGLTDSGKGSRISGSGIRLKDADIVARKESAERIWDTLKEDIFSLTQEWESGSKILRAEKRRGAAVGPSSPTLPSDIFGTSSQERPESASGVLESPLEAEEDALGRRGINGGGGGGVDKAGRDGQELTVLGQDSDDSALLNAALSNDFDLAALLLSTTSPAHLPPPGLEQVFEASAGPIGTATGADGRKLTREERIQVVKQQREQQHELQQRQKTGGTQAHAGVVTELKGVLEALRSQKGHGPQQDRTSASDGNKAAASSRLPLQRRNLHQPAATGLASPFDSPHSDAATGFSGTFDGVRPDTTLRPSGLGLHSFANGNGNGNGAAAAAHLPSNELAAALSQRASANESHHNAANVGNDTAGNAFDLHDSSNDSEHEGAFAR